MFIFVWIYIRMYLYIYVNLLKYVKRATSKVKLLQSVLVGLTLGSIQTKDTWKRLLNGHQDIISLVGTNYSRDIH